MKPTIENMVMLIESELRKADPDAYLNQVFNARGGQRHTIDGKFDLTGVAEAILTALGHDVTSG